jgi:hypothetical protein
VTLARSRWSYVRAAWDLKGQGRALSGTILYGVLLKSPQVLLLDETLWRLRVDRYLAQGFAIRYWA